MTSTDKTDKVADKGEKVKFIYQEGETVLCYHGPLLYEAKCMKFELRNKVPYYLIHYSGWNKSWDEWVTCPRVLKFNEENLKKQTELLATHGTSKILSKIKSNSRNARNLSNFNAENERISQDNEKANQENGSFYNSDLKKKKQKIDESSEHDESYQIKSDITIKMTDELKQILNEDYQNICNNNKLVTLPSTVSVEQLLNEYTHYKLDKKFDKNVINAIVDGLKVYFNVILSTKLLYKQERTQYSELMKNSNKKPIEIYGSIHFLRLFVKIGELLSYSYWDELSIKQLILHIEDVMKYLNENRATLFTNKMYT